MTTKLFSRAFFNTAGAFAYYAINGSVEEGSIQINKDTLEASLTGTPEAGLRMNPAKFIPLVSAAYALAALDIAEVKAQRAQAEALKVAQAAAAKKAEEAARKEAEKAARKEAEKAALFTTKRFDCGAYAKFAQSGWDVHVSVDNWYFNAPDLGLLIDHLTKIKAVLESRA